MSTGKKAEIQETNCIKNQKEELLSLLIGYY